jgi:hypothetical protein
MKLLASGSAASDGECPRAIHMPGGGRAGNNGRQTVSSTRSAFRSNFSLVTFFFAKKKVTSGRRHHPSILEEPPKASKPQPQD